MPGMNSQLSPASPILVSAFHSALLQQLLIVALIFVALAIAWGATRTALYGDMAGKSPVPGKPVPGKPVPGKPAGRAAALWREPRARLLLRAGFGVLWVVDGLLQAQPQMPGGLADEVIQPSASASPGWVQDLVNYGVNFWDYHPIQAASATVWIQLGVGLWLLIAVRGWSSRLAGLAGLAWGLLVWAFGEAFGGIFAPGLTVLFGAPGAALVYAVAGALIALPEAAWDNPRRLGRLVLGGTGVFFLGMALLQAWPGRGFWQGGTPGHLGSLSSMIASMASTPQPRAIYAIVSGFGNFTVTHGFAVNLVAVIALAVTGAGLAAAAARGDARLGRAAVIAGVVFCLADWVLVEDFGVFGGTGTDPNSMIPFVLLFTAGYLGLAPAPRPATAPAGLGAAAIADVPVMLAAPVPDSPDEQPATVPGPAAGTRRGGRVPGLVRSFAGTPGRVVFAAGALGVVLVGAAPMALATTNPDADPITAQAIAGTAGQFDTPASNFTLTSQDGKQVSLSSLRGKVVLLTFLDPVCTSDCPLIAQEMRSADTLLGAKAGDTELVAVVANPTYLSTAYTRAFTEQENLSQVPNWLYLTGSLSQLQSVWHAYGIEVDNLPAGAMTAHNDLAVVISANGTIRQELSDDPGPGTAATKASFASLLADSVSQTMSQS